jgi:lipid II:glycine glycyltransferase (peptidoglycan interpeptide bridge formation enzyme)
MKDIEATVIVDLLPTEEELLNLIEKSARNSINRSIREGLVVEKIDLSMEENWKEVYKMYVESRKEMGLNIEILDFLKKNVKELFICKLNNKIIAILGIWFPENYYKPNLPRLFLNCSLHEYRKTQPNNFLYWNAILEYKKKGYKEFDCGGWQINAKGRSNLEGVNRFKEKFGEVRIYKKQFPFFIAIGKKLIRNSKFFWELNEKIKKLKYKNWK